MRALALVLLSVVACKAREAKMDDKASSSLDPIVRPCEQAMATPPNLDMLLETIEADHDRGLSQLERMKLDLQYAEARCRNASILLVKVIEKYPGDPVPTAARTHVDERVRAATRQRPLLLNLLDAVIRRAPPEQLEPLYDAYVREVVSS